MIRKFIFPLLTVLLVGCHSPLLLNEIQVIGSHNSYKIAIDPELMAQISVADQSLAKSLDYSHATIHQQLDLGVRKFELDVFNDPEGGRYQNPAGLNRIAYPGSYDTAELQNPGFKVMHVQDIDFRSHCLALSTCLEQLVDWSTSHPDHLPVFITINAKDGEINLPGFVKPLAFDGTAWEALDQTLREGLADKLFTPDEFRGDLASLPAAVSRGWPNLKSMEGRFIVVLDHEGEKLQSYISGHPALQGRAMFVNATEGTAEAAIRIVNDPIADFVKIQALVRQGYIVRTRSDADTVEARSANTTRRDRAFASGAQIVSTDYYLPDTRFSDFQVRFPGGALARCNPVLRSGKCQIRP